MEKVGHVLFQKEEPAFYEEGVVAIFDTAAGRVIGTMSHERQNHVLLKAPAVMAFKYDKDGATSVPDLTPIAYAWESYWVCWAGVRGHVVATGEYLDAYTEYLGARSALGERKDSNEPAT